MSSPGCVPVQLGHVTQPCFICRPRPSRLPDGGFLLVLETCAPAGTAHPGLAGPTGQQSQQAGCGWHASWKSPLTAREPKFPLVRCPRAAADPWYTNALTAASWSLRTLHGCGPPEEGVSQRGPVSAWVSESTTDASSGGDRPPLGSHARPVPGADAIKSSSGRRPLSPGLGALPGTPAPVFPLHRSQTQRHRPPLFHLQPSGRCSAVSPSRQDPDSSSWTHSLRRHSGHGVLRTPQGAVLTARCGQGRRRAQTLALALGSSPWEAELLVHEDDVIVASGPAQSLAQCAPQPSFRTWVGGAGRRGAAPTTAVTHPGQRGLLGSAPSSAPFSHAASGSVASPVSASVSLSAKRAE